MNTNIWLKVAKYKVKIKNTDWWYNNTYTQYPITEFHYAVLKKAIELKEPFTWLCGINWDKIREINAKRDIKEFIPITHVKNNSDYSVKCSFWISHPLHNWEYVCNCSDKYGCLWIVFLEKLNKALLLDISSISDITDQMRKDYLNNL